MREYFLYLKLSLPQAIKKETNLQFSPIKRFRNSATEKGMQFKTMKKILKNLPIFNIEGATMSKCLT